MLTHVHPQGRHRLYISAPLAIRSTADRQSTEISQSQWMILLVADLFVGLISIYDSDPLSASATTQINRPDSAVSSK